MDAPKKVFLLPDHLVAPGVRFETAKESAFFRDFVQTQVVNEERFEEETLHGLDHRNLMEAPKKLFSSPTLWLLQVADSKQKTKFLRNRPL